MKKIERYTLCDTSIIPTYEEYVEYCEINEREPQDEQSDDYWEFVSETQTMEWEDMFENLKHSKKANVPCLLEGTLHLWNCSPEIQPLVFDNVADAIRTCANDIDYVEVTYENGHLEIACSHHDGTNHFQLYKLSKKGAETALNNRTDRKVSLLEPKKYWYAKWTDYIY